MTSLFDARRTIEPGHMEQIKTWARAVWQVADDATIMVTELECREPGCPPIETVIAIFQGKGRNSQHKIHKPASLVVEADLRNLATHDEHHHA